MLGPGDHNDCKRRVVATCIRKEKTGTFIQII